MLWSPAIRAALVAETPWLDVFCPGCGTSRAIDLRTVDRHPLASVGTLVLGLRCSWCPGSAPMPRLLACTLCHRRHQSCLRQLCCCRCGISRTRFSAAALITAEQIPGNAVRNRGIAGDRVTDKWVVDILAEEIVA
jgi:hypothetical protein